jgi:hypothetical protein
LAITRLVLSAVWWYAYDKPHLIHLNIDPSTLRAFHFRALYIPLTFLLSIGISFFSVSTAIYSWLLLVVGDSVFLYCVDSFRSSRRKPERSSGE